MTHHGKLQNGTLVRYTSAPISFRAQITAWIARDVPKRINGVSSESVSPVDRISKSCGLDRNLFVRHGRQLDLRKCHMRNDGDTEQTQGGFMVYDAQEGCHWPLATGLCRPREAFLLIRLDT